MRYDKHKIREKELLKLEHLRREIWEKQRKAPIVQLEKPYQRGWEISFDLIDEAKRRKDAPILLAILNKVSRGWTTQNVKTVRFIRSNPSVVARLHIPKKGIDWMFFDDKHYGWNVRYISVKDYEQLPTTWKRWFSKYIDADARREELRIRYRCVLPVYYIKMKVRPNIITHAYEKDPELESMEKYYYKKIDELKNKGYGTYHDYWGWKTWLDAKPIRAHWRTQRARYIAGEISDENFGYLKRKNQL